MEYDVIIVLNIWLSNIKIKRTEKPKEAENCQTMLSPPTLSWRHLKARCLELPDICLPLMLFFPGWVRESPLLRKRGCMQTFKPLLTSVNKISGSKSEACLISSNNSRGWTSLVAQWLRIHQPMQGIWAQAGKIPHAAEQLNPRATTTEACEPRARAPQQEKPPQWEARAPQRRRVAPARRN